MTAGTDELVARSDPAMVIVTTAALGERDGCLVGFHSQCSIEPFRYAVWISRANRTLRVAEAATHFAVHFLDEGDRELAELFGTETGDEVDKFPGRSTAVGEGGVPLLDGVPVIVFVKEAMWDDGGDHVCFVGNPVTAVVGADRPPLRLAATIELEPGHQADERPAADSPAPDRVDELQQLAAGFGHELTPEQIETLDAEHRAATDDAGG